MITFEQLKMYDNFIIEEESDSVFYKNEDRYDKAINAYKIKNKQQQNIFSILEPVIFPRDYKVFKFENIREDKDNGD